MTLIPLTQCSGMLSIDTKTLRQWLKHSNLSVHPHPTDARIKCLTIEQVHQLASLHDRSVTLDAGSDLEQVLSTPPLAQPETSLLPQTTNPLPSLQTDPELIRKLASLEATVTTLQQQLTQLALELLHERDLRFEQRLSTLEAQLSASAGPSSDPQMAEGPAVACPQSGPTDLRWHPNPAELRAHSRIVPLIEYAADHTYVIVSPQEGELFITPDSPEWFDWLASLSSFRFMGKLGRFNAYRDSRRGGPRRCWSAVRGMHSRRYKSYLGVTDRLTIACLEQVAAKLLSQATSF